MTLHELRSGRGGVGGGRDQSIELVVSPLRYSEQDGNLISCEIIPVSAPDIGGLNVLFSDDTVVWIRSPCLLTFILPRDRGLTDGIILRA